MVENILWIIVVAGGPVVLGLAIAYALVTRRRRSRAQREISEREVDRLYTDNEPKP
jgi:hypothetical protein